MITITLEPNDHHVHVTNPQNDVVKIDFLNHSKVSSQSYCALNGINVSLTMDQKTAKRLTEVLNGLMNNASTKPGRHILYRDNTDENTGAFYVHDPEEVEPSYIEYGCLQDAITAACELHERICRPVGIYRVNEFGEEVVKYLYYMWSLYAPVKDGCK